MSQSELVRIDPQTRAIMRARMDADPWYFSKYVCKHAEKAVERIHRPLLYIYTGQAALLAATLSNPRFEGAITAQVRADFEAQTPPIDWTDPKQMPRVKARLRRVNIRLPRRSGKSTFADDGDLWQCCVNPDSAIGLGTKSDDYAYVRIDMIGRVVTSPEFLFWYPERVPLDPKRDITKSAILLAGRTINIPEASIEGRGVTSQWTGRHFNCEIRGDDIVGTESGEASVEDALRFQANTDAIKVSPIFGVCREVWIGTINGENDDHANLSSDPDVMSVVMPIEEHEGGTTVENLFKDGALTMGEDGWFSRSVVNEIKRAARSNEGGRGVVWLLQNFYMAAHKSGSVVMTKSMLDKAKGIFWIYSEDLQREVLYLPKKSRESTYRPSPDEVAARDWSPKFKIDDWRVVDVATLPRYARAWAGDQSVSQNGDEWSFAYVVMDHEGVEILLDCIKGRGYDKMLDAVVPFDKDHGKPKHVGLDTNATQGMTVEWMDRTAEFQDIARRVVPITSGGEAKDAHIRRWIGGRILTGDFYVNPRLNAWLHEAGRYQPRKPDGTLKRNAIDNQLDATWMACSLCKRPPAPEQLEAEEAAALLGRIDSQRHRDPVTGIDTSSWMDCMWDSRRVA